MGSVTEFQNKQTNNKKKRNIKQRQIIGLLTICPSTVTDPSLTPCKPKTAFCGILIFEVPYNEPETPPLEIMKVPPVISSRGKITVPYPLTRPYYLLFNLYDR